MKRLYKSVSCDENYGNFPLILDGKIALTPLKNSLIVPSALLAEAIAHEWRIQKEKIDKETMPLTQIACIAIDLVGHKRAGVIEDIMVYAETDLVCYRAGEIPALCAQQAQELDPIVTWIAEHFKIQLTITDGLMPVAQPSANAVALKEILARYDDWTLAALVVATKALSSVVLALALVERRINSEQAFHLSHLEELYESQKWGKDSEKEAKMQKTNQGIMAVERFLTLRMSSKNLH